jgi:hypothetical protein|tara:strand:- start:1338 stop:1838 length:501 start_codon:yes stop_codon:yes gene_type:complete
MKLEVLRISSGPDSTSGILFIVDDSAENPHGEGFRCKRSFVCYTLEDEHRDEKKYGETRIPAGTYKIKLRKEGGYHQKYSKRFPKIHRGMLHITDVPNFEYILIHCGNTDEHTAGCLLVGDSQENNQINENGFIGKSTQAYKRIYPRIAEALVNNKEVLITYKDIA